jgi:hypothetical protein
MSTPEAPAASRGKVIRLTLYYIAILLAVVYLHAQGNFTAPPFVYQGF